MAICTCCIYYTSSPKLSISNCTENILMVPHLIQRCTEENWFVLIFCMYMHKDMTEWWISQCGHCDLNLGWQLQICYFLYHECCLCPNWPFYSVLASFYLIDVCVKTWKYATYQNEVAVTLTLEIKINIFFYHW